MRIPIHREGWPYIALAAGIDLVALAFLPWLGWVILPLLIWVVAFFRDPERTPPAGENLVLSPADGKMLSIVEAPPPAELGMSTTPLIRLSIFMNVFNVHVNRIPCNGTVTALAYRPGKFINASFDKASEDNERMAVRLRMKSADIDLVVVQIAGLVARRIKCDLKNGEDVCRGDRFGIIRFGSRLDVYLPVGARVLVKPGQIVTAGETVLAELP